MRVELGAARAALALGLGLARDGDQRRPADHGGNADPVARGRLATRETGTDGVQDAHAKVLAVSTGHGCLPQEGQGITPKPPREGQPHDSEKRENALG